MRFQLALNKTFCLTLQRLTHRRATPHLHSTAKIQKLTKQCFLPPLIGFPQKVHNITIEKQIKYSIITIIELGPPVSESSTSLSIAPIDTEHKFNKTGIENGLPIGFNLGSS